MMRTQAWTWMVSWSLMLALGLVTTLALVGCESAGSGAAVPSLATPGSSPANARSSGSGEPRGESALAQETRAMAERLSASIDTIPADDLDLAFDPFADAMPFPSERPATEPAEPTPDVPAVADRELALLSTQPDPQVMVDVPGGAYELKPATVVPMPEMKPLGREELLAELSAQVRASDDSDLAKAVTAAALSLAQPDHQLDPAVLEPLKPMQRDAVERLHTLFLGIRQRAVEQGAESPTSRVQVGGPTTTGGGGFDRKMLDAALADAFGEMPVTIVYATLCRSVSGFGVFEPLGSHNFLAGRANRAIVYVEVENFAAAKLNDDRREVRLSQELILYKEDDGLAVWRHEPTQITDVSRNRRRDFYVVQMITLPARLSAGKYRLKVRITDQHGDSVDETTLKIHVVADAQLLGPDVVE